MFLPEQCWNNTKGYLLEHYGIYDTLDGHETEQLYAAISYGEPVNSVKLVDVKNKIATGIWSVKKLQITPTGRFKQETIRLKKIAFDDYAINKDSLPSVVAVELCNRYNSKINSTIIDFTDDIALIGVFDNHKRACVEHMYYEMKMPVNIKASDYTWTRSKKSASYIIHGKIGKILHLSFSLGDSEFKWWVPLPKEFHNVKISYKEIRDAKWEAKQRIDKRNESSNAV